MSCSHRLLVLPHSIIGGLDATGVSTNQDLVTSGTQFALKETKRFPNPTRSIYIRVHIQTMNIIQNIKRRAKRRSSEYARYWWYVSCLLSRKSVVYSEDIIFTREDFPLQNDAPMIRYGSSG